MNEGNGTIRAGIQGQSGGAVATAGERDVGGGCAESRYWSGNALQGCQFDTRQQAMDEGIDWLMFYDHRKLHSTLGYVSPMQFEKNWFAAQFKNAA